MGVLTEQRLVAEAGRAPDSMVEAVTRVLITAGQRPIRAAAMTRILNILSELFEEIPSDDQLADAVSAPSDYQVLLSLVGTPAAMELVRGTGRRREDDRLLRARIRGLEAKRRLLQAEGGTLTSSGVAELLGISRQAVDKRRRAGKLIGIFLPRGYAYPVWQFLDGEAIAGLDKVLSALQGHSPWMQLAFMLQPNVRLEGRTPLDELRHGNLTDVLRAARTYGEHGAA